MAAQLFTIFCFGSRVFVSKRSAVKAVWRSWPVVSDEFWPYKGRTSRFIPTGWRAINIETFANITHYARSKYHVRDTRATRAINLTAMFVFIQARRRDTGWLTFSDRWSSQIYCSAVGNSLKFPLCDKFSPRMNSVEKPTNDIDGRVRKSRSRAKFIEIYYAV